MKNELFIPKKLAIGFQNRKDTFTGKLAYITYYDHNEKLRKAGSWESWCSKDIPKLEISNEPISGYILNKDVSRNGYWGSGRSVIRIYDPRDFEFEIAVDNLLGILMHSDLSKREIFEKCILAWSGQQLVLLPINSEEYQSSLKFTEKQSLNLSFKNLLPGQTLNFKKGKETAIYLGRYDFIKFGYYDRGIEHLYTTDFYDNKKSKKHIFYFEKTKDNNPYIPYTPYFAVDNLNKFAEIINEEPPLNFSNILEDYLNSKYHSPIKSFEFVPGKLNLSSYYGNFIAKHQSNYLNMRIQKHFLQKNVSPLPGLYYNHYYSLRVDQIIDLDSMEIVKPDLFNLKKNCNKEFEDLSKKMYPIESNSSSEQLQLDMEKKLGLEVLELNFILESGKRIKGEIRC